MSSTTQQHGIPQKFVVYTERTLEEIPQLQRLDDELRHAMRVVAQVLPFRVNNYVIEQLIDWENVPDDPIFQLTSPATMTRRLG